MAQEKRELKKIPIKIAVYTTSSGIILGRKTGSEVTGVFIKNAKKVSEDDFANLMKSTVKDELTEIHIGGNNSFSKRKLNGTEELSSKVVELQMQEAVRTSETWLVENVFDELRGK